MTPEEKQILLKDLCGRLLYGVIINYFNVPQNSNIDAKVIGYSNGFIDIDNHSLNPEFVKPYLRQMRSITKEEKEEIKPLFSEFTDEFGKRVLVVRQNKMALYQDWLNAHHFDYRRLIEKGLALEAPEDMYK